MTLENQNILLISPESWGQNFVSKHHYAVALAQQGNTVYFLNPPSSSYKSQPTQYNNLYVIDYPPFLKGLRYLPEALQRMIICRRYERLQQLAQCSFDIVWSFDNSVFYNFDALPESVLKISHIVDLNQNFQTAKAASTADVCFCTTNLIRERLIQYNSNTYKIHHGYAPSAFNPPSVSLPGISNIKAVYVGNLSFAYIDWKLLLQVAKSNPNVDFVFVGPDGSSNLSRTMYHPLEKEELKALPNSFFVGSVPHEQIPSIVEASDILLVAYREQYHRDQASPHKFMDYFGSGKIAVATYTDEYKDKQELLAMSEKNEDYPALFTEIISNTDQYNHWGEQEKRKRFAFDNTYTEQIERIECHIRESYTIKAT